MAATQKFKSRARPGADLSRYGLHCAEPLGRYLTLPPLYILVVSDSACSAQLQPVSFPSVLSRVRSVFILSRAPFNFLYYFRDGIRMSRGRRRERATVLWGGRGTVVSR